MTPTLTQKALAWGVHTFTASGIATGFMAVVAIKAHDWKLAMIWLVASLVIDGIDGTFARMFRVKEVLPHINGKTIDNVIDFCTYVFIPAYLFYEAQLVPEVWLLPCTLTMVVVSALYYGIEGMVSEDMYFIGFPCLWNMVVFYMIFVFQFSPMGNVLWVLLFAVLHFMPVKFVYPSQSIDFKYFTIGLTVVFILTLAAILFVYPERNMILTWSAILTAVGYGGLTVYHTFK